MTEIKDLTAWVRERIAQGDVELPVFDEIALRLEREVREENLDAGLMCDILEEDPSLVSELLRVANSSIFAGLTPVATLREASVRLGVRQIASIVFSVSHKRMYSAYKGLFKDQLERLWEHSAAVAEGSRWLASNAGYRFVAEEAYVTGLLHDVGKLSLISIIEGQMVDLSTDMPDIVNRTIHELYCEHGAHLAQLWNLPPSVVETIRQQNDENLDTANVLLCLTRLVNSICVNMGIDDQSRTDVVADIDCIIKEALESNEAQALSLLESDIAELIAFLKSSQESPALAA